MAAADHVIVTKPDLATPEVTEDLKAKLRSINPAATIVDASFGSIDFAPLLAEESHRADEGLGLGLVRDQSVTICRHDGAGGRSRHERSGCLPVSRLRPPAQLADVRHLVDHAAPPARGPRPAAERPAQRRRGRGPLLVEGVQHVIHVPRHLRSGRTDRRSRIVFIARDLDLAQVEASLDAFQDLAAV